jgi:integrase
MRRRRFQRGSLSSRKRRGRLHWYAQWRENGQPRSKELGLCSQISRAQAETQLAAILQHINEQAGRPQRSISTFRSFVESVYVQVYRGKWKASTARMEEDRLRFHLVRELGDEMIDKISRERLQAFLNEKASSLSHSVVDHLRFRLRSIFALAMSEGLVDRNPAATLFTPRACRKSKEKRTLGRDQIRRLLAAVDTREELVVRLATFEGMRPGEILALQIGDWDGESVWVRRAIYKGRIDTPKNQRSFRRVALSQATQELLQAWIGQLPDSSSDAWLFPSESLVNPVLRDNLWRRHLKPRLEKIGLEWATFQVMRRTFATLSKQAGVDAHTRSAQMGNTVDVNENEYAVSSFEERLKAVRKLETTVWH